MLSRFVFTLTVQSAYKETFQTRTSGICTLKRSEGKKRVCQIPEVVGVPSDLSTQDYGDFTAECSQFTENVGPLYIHKWHIFLYTCNRYAHVHVCGEMRGNMCTCMYVFAKTHSNSTGT